MTTKALICYQMVAEFPSSMSGAEAGKVDPLTSGIITPPWYKMELNLGMETHSPSAELHTPL